jgi:DNA polymerase elongation subunit (family B)
MLDIQMQILEYYRCLNNEGYIDDGNGNGDSEEENTEDLFSEAYQMKLVKTQPMLIKLFGITTDGKSCTINLSGFEPFFFVKIPEDWTTKECAVFFKFLKTKVWKKFSDNLLKIKLIKRKPFTEFTADDLFKFVQLSFLNKESYDAYARTLIKPLLIPNINMKEPYQFKLFESNIDPIIKFIHMKELNSTGWINIPAGKYKTVSKWSKTCSTFYEFNMNWNDIEPIEKFETSPIKLVSFDIEASSSHGDFPIAKKDYRKLSQDLITFYNTYNDINIIKDYPEKVILNILQIAFDDNFNNNVISRLSGLEFDTLCRNLKDDDIINNYIDEIINSVKLNYSDKLNYSVNGTFQIKYNNLFEQIKAEIIKLTIIKNSRYLKYPREVIKFLIKLSINPYYDSTKFNINKVYTKHGIKPNSKNIDSSVPLILQILRGCFQFRINKIISDNEIRELMYYYKKARLERGIKEPDMENINQDDFVDILTDYFNSNFPPVEGDQIIQIGSTFQIIGQSDCYLKHIICLDTCNNITNDELIEAENGNVYLPAEDLSKVTGISVNEIKNMTIDQRRELCKQSSEIKRKKQMETDKSRVIVEFYKTEDEVLFAWQRLIISEDPDIITGYNIFGFDFRFMYGRAVELDITNDFCKLSRLKDHVSKLTEMKVASAALGDNKLEYIEMKGRVLIDLYKVIQTSQSLDNYKLDFVCNKFLYKEKVDLSPQDIFIKQRGDADDRKEIAKYCIIDCILCNRLIAKLEILGNSVAMASVCKVPLSYIFLRGQGVKIASSVSYVCNQNGYLIPVLPKADGDNQGYEGAIVLQPEIGIHFETTVTLDFNSLYPSSMISENLSTDTFVEINGKYDNLEGYEYVNIEYDQYEWKPSFKNGKLQKKMEKIKLPDKKVCRFVQPKILYDSSGKQLQPKKGIIPMILESLLAARKSAKAKMEAESDPFKAKIWNGLQLAYKTVSNSVYGQLGAPTGLLYKPEIAASTTAVGRRMITFSRDYVMKEYKYKKVILSKEDTLDSNGNTTQYEGREIIVRDSYCVYGDTDSIFIRFNMFKLEPSELTGVNEVTEVKIEGRDAIFISMALGKQVAKEISRQLKRPQNLDFEKVICPFILFSKKRYCGHYYTKMNKDSFYLNSMGIVLKRRDNAPIVKHIYGGVIKIIMNEKNIKKAYEFLIDECKKLLNGDFPMDQFTVSKTLKSYYKFPTRIAHNVLAMRQAQRDPGNKFSSNDRIPYVYIEVPKLKKGAKKQLQGDLIETPAFIIKNNLKINYSLYLTNQIQVPVSQIFSLVKGYENIDRMFELLIIEKENEKLGIQKLKMKIKVKNENEKSNVILMSDIMKLKKHVPEIIEDGDGDGDGDGEDKGKELIESDDDNFEEGEPIFTIYDM